VENSGRREEWDKYFNMIDPIYDENYFAVVGNHDVENNYALWHKYWDLPNNERWYSFDRGGAHFIVVDNVNSRDTWGSLGAEQEAWLDADLEDNCDEASFCFVFMHVPPVSWNEGLALNGQRWLSLLRQHGVDAIFAGHIHNYERGNYGDIGFVTTAGGGNKFHKLKDLPVADKTLTELNHFVKISTSEDRTIGCVYDLQGDEIDSFEILKR
jgi:3',5'-cyclic AMP phosphodiesterase CpdA